MKKFENLNLGYENPSIKEANTFQNESEGTAQDQQRKRGRPAKNPADVRSKRLSIALTEQEVKDLHDISVASGIGTSEIVRVIVQRFIDAQDMDNIHEMAQERERFKVDIWEGEKA